MRKFLPFVMLSVFVRPAVAQDFDWPMYQGWPDHRGYIPISVDAAHMSLNWQVQMGTRDLGAAIAADGMVFVTMDDGIDQGVYAYDAETGVLEWHRSFYFASATLPVAYYLGTLYFQSIDGSLNTWLYVIESANGDPVTQIKYETQFQRYLAPTVTHHQIFVPGGRSGGMYGMQIGGDVLWFHQVADRDGWTPAVERFGGAYAYGGGLLTRVDDFSGNLEYQVTDPNWISGPNDVGQAPVLGGMNNVLVTNNSRLVSFDRANGSIQWELTDDFRGQVSYLDGKLYVMNGGKVEERSETDGALIQTYWGGGYARGAIVVTDSHLFFCDEDETFGIDRNTFALDWSYPLEGLLSMGQGNLYIAQDNGTLTAIRYDHPPTPESIIPMYVNYYESAGVKATISGYGFDEPGNTQVAFDGIPATNVNVLDSHTLECDLPAMDSTMADIAITDSSGTSTLEDGIVFTPYHEWEGVFQIGGANDCNLYFQLGDDFRMWADLDAPFAQGQPYPPFHGLWWLTTPIIVLDRRDWATNTYSDFRRWANNPSLIGRTLATQIIAGDSLKHGVGAFSSLQLNTFQ